MKTVMISLFSFTLSYFGLEIANAGAVEFRSPIMYLVIPSGVAGAVAVPSRCWPAGC